MEDNEEGVLGEDIASTPKVQESVLNEDTISKPKVQESVKSKKSRNSNKMDYSKNNESDCSTNVIFYGDVNEVNSLGNHSYESYLKLAPKNQKMEGFDDCYDNFVDYIIKITHWIWEEHGIGVIYDTYAPSVIMHLGSSNLCGVKDVIGNTLSTLYSFPDRRLMGQDVVWSNHGEKGFMSSHRILSIATNLNDSTFGPATGRKINFRTTVDCAVENNLIYEEWLVRDNLWIVQQLGLDAVEVAKRMARNGKDKQPALQKEFGLAEAMYGQIAPTKYTAKDNSVAEFMLEALNHIYQGKYFNELKNYYAKNAVVHFICDKDLVGHDQIRGSLISLFASFPNAHYQTARIMINDHGTHADIAVRWYLRGTHEGLGYFGTPSGKQVIIFGISHFKVQDGKIVEEWVTFDALDALRQIHTDDCDECECFEE